jgi:putative transposase
MPWKKTSQEQQRYDLVRRMIGGQSSIAELSRQFGVSRQTAYKWRQRYKDRRSGGLREKSRRPLFLAAQTANEWLRRVRRLRSRHRTWGARKLRHVLWRRFGETGVPSAATIGRWLKRWGLSRGRRRRLRGPQIQRQAVQPSGACHEVWTVDFKGWYRTGDGTRVDPLTVRDLHSRYGLGIVLLSTTAIDPTQRAMRRLFLRHGVPRRIRCDNGTPFGAIGTTGLTRLSAWWVKLGIEVEFITPGRPSENGAHEQFHRVYKAEVAEHPARTVRGQQRRSDRWLAHYNGDRPHEALGMKTPSEVFKSNRRRMAKPLKPWRYPTGWAARWVKGNGEINWRGKRRYVGEAFVRDYVGLKATKFGVWRVYFGPMLVGELREKEVGAIRMARYARGG